MTTKEHDLEKSLDRLRDELRALGETVNNGFERMSRQVKDMDQRWTNKWATRDVAIWDHERRRKHLERRR
jgi:hypothetical protein